MKILNFGSLNLDYVYEVEHFPEAGETLFSKSFSIFCGGKGLNQSIAAAKAGNAVFHAGILGEDGDILEQELLENGVDISLLSHIEAENGHAIIQVDKNGQNCILLYGGTNRMFTEEYIDSVLEVFEPEGLVLLQNETNLVGDMIRKAHEKGLKTALNAAPMDETVKTYPLELLDWLIVNEVEGRQLAGCEKDEDILPVLKEKYPETGILLTLGSRGAMCCSHGETYRIGSFKTEVKDTTAAGDTFTGYFLTSVMNGGSIPEALLLATTASAIAIGRKGAASSIPTAEEVEYSMKNHTFGILKAEKI